MKPFYWTPILPPQFSVQPGSHLSCSSTGMGIIMTTAKYPLELMSNSWLPCGYFQAFCFILELGEKVWLWHFLLSGREFSPCSPLPQGRANCTFRVPSSVLLLTLAPLPSHMDVPRRVEDTEQQGTSLEIPVGGDCDGTSALLVSIWP